MKTLKSASEIKEGDQVYFPNSRHPQEVKSVSPAKVGPSITVRCDTASWSLASDYPIAVEVPNGD